MNKGVIIFWILIVATAGWRVWSTFDLRPPDLSACVRSAVQGVGVVSSDPERKESGQIVVVRVAELRKTESGEACGVGIILRMKTDLYPRLQFGDSVNFSGNLSKPFNFKSESGRTFNYEGYLAKENIFYEIKSAKVEILEADTANPLSIQSVLYRLKRKFVGNLEQVLGEPHAALAAGLVVGEKSALGADLLDDFRTVGLIHIVVLSGYNITIVADAMRRMLVFLPRVWGIAVGGAGIILFGILVGGGATVVRSCLMATVALFGEVIRRDYNAGRALVFAGLIMIIQNPKILLFDPSFQLSFMATLGLILLSGPFEEKLGFITEKFGMRGIVASTIATQIFVAPYILYMMGDLSLIGTLVNILVLPIIPLTMLMVFLAGAVGFIVPVASTLLGYGAHALLSYELKMVEWFADIPLASFSVPKFSGWITVLVYIVIVCIYAIYALRKKVQAL